LNDLAGDAAHSKTLLAWRGRMIEHFAERGEPFLIGGKLAPRPKRLDFSPHYPKERG
jgi:hypothetical protein